MPPKRSKKHPLKSLGQLFWLHAGYLRHISGHSHSFQHSAVIHLENPCIDNETGFKSPEITLKIHLKNVCLKTPLKNRLKLFALFLKKTTSMTLGFS